MSKSLLFWRKHNEENRAIVLFQLIDWNWRVSLTVMENDGFIYVAIKLFKTADESRKMKHRRKNTSLRKVEKIRHWKDDKCL